jgi:hypothetical protein
MIIGGTMARTWWIDYAIAEKSYDFPLQMLLARLACAACATLLSGAVTARFALGERWPVLILGLVLLLSALPEHTPLLVPLSLPHQFRTWVWEKFPLWYHLSMIGMLLPLTALGGKCAIRHRPGELPSASSGR